MAETRRGIGEQGETPDWEPLLRLAPKLVDDFMWMFEGHLDDGDRVQAYKHIETRDTCTSASAAPPSSTRANSATARSEHAGFSSGFWRSGTAQPDGQKIR